MVIMKIGMMIVEVYPIFLLARAIVLSASRHRVCPSLNWGISEDIPNVTFPNFQPFFYYDKSGRLKFNPR